MGKKSLSAAVCVGLTVSLVLGSTGCGLLRREHAVGLDDVTGNIDPSTIRSDTVTQEGWEKAFSSQSFANATMRMTVNQKQPEYYYDVTVINDGGKLTSFGVTAGGTVYYEYDGGKYYGYQKAENGWVKEEVTQERYESGYISSYLSEILEAIDYSVMEYVSPEEGYQCYVMFSNEHRRFRVKFLDGKVVSIVVSLGFGEAITILFYHYGSSRVEFPETV